MTRHIIFGVNAQNLTEYVGLPLDNLTHAHFKGMTGHGKSSLLSILATSLIRQGVGVTLIDPAGDLARQVLTRLVKHKFFERPDAFDRVVYLDTPRAFQRDMFFPMNVLSGPYDPHTAANVVLEGYKRIWPNLQDGTSTNIETLVKLGAYVLAENGLPFLPYFEDLYTNPEFQRSMLTNIRDEQIRKQFRVMELEPTRDLKGRAKIPEIASTSLKREFLLSFSPVVRYALCQPHNLFDFANIVDSGRSMLLNLRVADPDAKKLLGCLITEQVEALAKSRGSLTEAQQRRRHVVIIDEVQNFVYQSGLALENMFAEARRANISVWVVHQYGAQLSESLNAAVSQCGVKVVFRLGFDDALISVKQMGFPIDPHWVKQILGTMFSPGGTHNQYYAENEQWTMHAQNVQQLGPREAYIQLLNGQPFRVRTLPVPPYDNMRVVEEIEDAYLTRYFRNRADIEQETAQIQAHYGITERDILKTPPQPAPQQSAPTAAPPPDAPAAARSPEPPVQAAPKRPRRSPPPAAAETPQVRYQVDGEVEDDYANI